MESVLYIVPALIIVIVFLSTAIKILREYERAVIFRLGRLIAAKGPGLVLLIPLLDKMVKLSLRTLAMEVPVPVRNLIGQCRGGSTLGSIVHGPRQRRRCEGPQGEPAADATVEGAGQRGSRSR
jgi:regulator of protease activity HflC (stomatin/prohibitin superfamily)